MNDQDTLYRIKPLEWHDEAGQYWYATIPGINLGRYEIDVTSENHFKWYAPFGYVGGTVLRNEPTLEAAKSAAESHYRQRLEKALEVVEDPEEVEARAEAIREHYFETGAGRDVEY